MLYANRLYAPYVVKTVCSFLATPKRVAPKRVATTTARHMRPGTIHHITRWMHTSMPPKLLSHGPFPISAEITFFLRIHAPHKTKTARARWAERPGKNPGDRPTASLRSLWVRISRDAVLAHLSRWITARRTLIEIEDAVHLDDFSFSTAANLCGNLPKRSVSRMPCQCGVGALPLPYGEHARCTPRRGSALTLYWCTARRAGRGSTLTQQRNPPPVRARAYIAASRICGPRAGRVRIPHLSLGRQRLT